MLEAFDAARHAPATVGLLFGQGFGKRAWARAQDGRSAESNITIKKWDARKKLIPKRRP